MAYFPSAKPSRLLGSKTVTTTGALLNAGTVFMPPARGLFVVNINDVAGGSLLSVTIEGGISRKFNDPANIYTVRTDSPLNQNVTINDVGTAGVSNGQTTIDISDTGGATARYDLVYNAYTYGDSATFPTITLHAGSAVPAGNVIIQVTYLNCGPPLF